MESHCVEIDRIDQNNYALDDIELHTAALNRMNKRIFRLERNFEALIELKEKSQKVAISKEMKRQTRDDSCLLNHHEISENAKSRSKPTFGRDDDIRLSDTSRTIPDEGGR